jgi:predicted RNA-binding protein with EMAP domain
MQTKIHSTFFILLLLLQISSYAQDRIENNGKGDRTHTYRNNTGVTSTDLEYRGKIIFTDDETDVKYISPGGFLRFSKRSFGNKRTIFLEGEDQGVITREYREGSKKLPFDPEGRKWMASVLPDIIRTTGIGAEERVKKFYKEGGIDAVIAEISMLPTNYVQSKYYTAALELPNLSANEQIRLIKDAGQKIGSSYELSKILVANGKNISKNEKAVAAAIEVAGEISSSYEQSKVYKHYLTKTDISADNKTMVIKGVREISSSYEKSKVLLSALQDDLNKENIDLVIDEVQHVNSSYEQSKVLQYLIKNQSTEELELDNILKAISEISSSYEQGKVLRQLVGGKELSTKQVVTVTKAASYINSDYEQSKFLQSILSEQELDEEALNAILSMTNEVNSSYEKSKILQLIIASDNFGKTNFTAIINETKKISSSYEKSKVLALVIAHDEMSVEQMLNLIRAISGISSNYEKSKLLQALGKQMPEDKEVQEAFYGAAKSLSDTEYGKVMRAMH